MLPKVLVTGRLPSATVSRLSEQCDVVTHRGEGAMSRAELLDAVRDVDGILSVLTARMDAELFDRAPRLKVVANVAVGYDNVDVAEAARRGIVVTNTPDVLTETVAEFTWALILAVTRRVVEGDRLIRAGGWRTWGLDFMLGTSLAGKQLGIIGMGRIGRAVAARAGAFGMRVAYVRRGEIGPGVGTIDKVNLADVAAPAAAVTLDQLLLTSDVVSVHVPATPGTRGMIAQREFVRMKRTAYFVNTSRGSVVDEAALAWALEERIIAGAAVDVYEREPDVPDALRRLDNVVLAPHIASATRETRTAMADLAVSNVLAVLSGNAPLTPVHPR